MISGLIAGSLRMATGALARWHGCGPELRQRIYFANHTSNLDGPLLWASLPAPLRMRTRMVAAHDYWSVGRLRPWLAQSVFRAVLIERKKPTAECNPLDTMLQALGDDHSLIIFPEGGRQTSPDPQPFKAGLFHLAKRRPEVELVPVWMENLNRILPKGEFLPAPLLGSLVFGTPIRLEAGETKVDFLERARQSVICLRETTCS
ncbi:lysophospholipid acyltransferase family protein [Prosthecobacter algae]|uniref:Lysophospholipid acyltransferase family protein n=1 Tax=Prosthecobacter algae TaxID=1144682 RepID=A0ABP9PAK4_9BACT